jgi:prepilin-type N-terminal cleavage/methylation domain-containing protein
MRFPCSRILSQARAGRAIAAFTLIEVLAVLAIMAAIAAIVAPTLTTFRKGDVITAATRQMLDAVGRARQLAISQRTTVFMVFVPTNFWAPTQVNFMQNLTEIERKAGNNLVDLQLTGYNFLTLHSVGDQPGRPTPNYLASWQTLPQGTFIPLWKFDAEQLVKITDPVTLKDYYVERFPTMAFPFPTESAAYKLTPHTIVLPYVAFNYLGQLASADGQPLNRDEYIPLAHGSVLVQRNADKVPVMYDVTPGNGPIARESPPDNSRINFNLIHIDRLTGRARVERREMK